MEESSFTVVVLDPGTMLSSSTCSAYDECRQNCSTAGLSKCSASISSLTRAMPLNGAYGTTWPSWWIIFSIISRSVLKVEWYMGDEERAGERSCRDVLFLPWGNAHERKKLAVVFRIAMWNGIDEA